MYNYVLHIYRQYVTGKQYEEILEPTAKNYELIISNGQRICHLRV